jgi:ABC-2 type transport system permease protein
MRAYLSFTGKEFTESFRTYKLFAMVTVFLILGMMSPFLARYTNEIIAAAAPELELTFPEPTMLDSWAQFFSNAEQLGLITLAIVFSGLIASELRRGTLINMLTKGLKRSTVILSKFTAATIIWTLSYLLCIGAAYAYTAYFWEIDGMSNIFLSFFSLWLFGVLLISLVILGGVLFKSMIGSLLFTGGFLIVAAFLTWIPKTGDYNPTILSSSGFHLMFDIIELSEIVPAMIVCGAVIIILIVTSIAVLNKKQL